MRTSDDPAVDAASRRRRFAALAMDAAAALLALIAGVFVAGLWLMLRTGLGRNDVADGDAVVAASLVGAALPAWAAWLAARVRRDGATPGQRLAGLSVVLRAGVPPRARMLRLAIHPLALPLWGWLTLTALLSGLPWLWLAPLLSGAAVALAGVVSLLMLLARPRLRAIHDLVARTALAPRP